MKLIARLFFDNVAPFILAIAAMIGTAPGPVEWVGLCRDKKLPQTMAVGAPSPQRGFDECKSEVRLAMLLLAFALKVLIDLVNHQFPLRKLEKFRGVYLDSTVKPKWEELKSKYKDEIRINIMVARRRWWLFWLYGSFDFEYPLGFSAPRQHRDIRLHLFWFQGVAGKAFRTEEPVAEYLPIRAASAKPTWRLFRRQAVKTDHVRWILSVPMYRGGKPGETEKPKVRGVINIDVTDDAVAQVLRADTAEVAGLIDYFLKIGRLASHLW